jgi:hypothetical protein
MLELRRWRQSSMLREKLMMLRPPLRRMLRSHKNLRLARRRKLKKLWLMPTRSMLNENKPLLSVFTPCLLLLKVSFLPYLLLSTSVALVYLLTLVSSFLFYCAGLTGVSPSSLQMDDDPLIDAINLLEENWISIQETFELVGHVLSRLFAGLWPKKRSAIPKDNLTELAKSFDTTEDPTL